MLLIAAALLMGCDTSVYEILSRSKSDPVADAPLVRSFVRERDIYISWKEDKMADWYILERAEDSAAGLFFTEIYRGKEFSYIDTNAEDEKLYLYRLYKQRGNKSGWVSQAILGVGSLVRMDEHEPNNREENATWIGPMRISNIFYYKARDGQVVSDEDWYYVIVPAYTIATIVLRDYQVAAVDGTTHFKIIVSRGGPVSQVINNSGIDLVNPDNEEKRIYFKITADESRFVTSPGQSGGGVVQYEIYILQMSRL